MSEISVSENERFAIGYDDGSIDVRNIQTNKNTITLKSMNKLIQSISWHPRMFESGESEYKNYLAVGSNDYHIHVWNVPCNQDEDEKILTNPNVVLEGHHARVIQVAWSPFDEELLLSVSYDWSAQIWNGIKGEPLANFDGHQGRLYCGLWSPNDKNIVFTGSEDSTLLAWNINSQKSKIPVKREKKKKEFKKLEGLNSNNSEEVKKERKINKNIGIKCFELSKIEESKHLESTPADCLLIDDYLTSNKLENIPNYLHVYLNDEDFTEKCCVAEIDYLKSKNKIETAACSQLMSTGDIGTIIRQAMSEGRLSDWLVSLACMTSQKLWREACLVYADQLIKTDSDYIKASTYFIMAHKPLDAIESLRKGGHYREAVTLAKSSLPTDDDVIKETYHAWAVQAVNNGNYELAAKAFAAAGERESCANMLAKKSDTECLKAAGEILKRAENFDRSRVVLSQVAGIYFEKGNFSGLKELISNDDDLSRKFNPIILIHENLPLYLPSEDENRFWIESSIDKCQIILKFRELFETRLKITDWENEYSNYKSQQLTSYPLYQELILAVLSKENRQCCLNHILQCIVISYEKFDLNYAVRMIHGLGLRITDPPQVGTNLWAHPLDWQCQWPELRSIQCYVAYIKLKHLVQRIDDEDTKLTFQEFEDLSDNLMLDDVMYSQMLLFEIKEAENFLKDFTPCTPEEALKHIRKQCEPIGNNMGKEAPKNVHGNGVQTMELGQDGNWNTILTDDIPEPAGDMPKMPKPMVLRPNFKEMYLDGSMDDIEARKEIERLKWLSKRTNALTFPFPDLTDGIKELLLLMTRKEEDLKVLAKSKEIATWGFWKAPTLYQPYFLNRA